MQEPKPDGDTQLTEQVNQVLTASLGTLPYLCCLKNSFADLLSCVRGDSQLPSYCERSYICKCFAFTAWVASVAMHARCWYVAGDADEASEMEHDSDADADAVRCFAQPSSSLPPGCYHQARPEYC